MTEAKANDRQVGGDHYKGIEYEHWDFMTDIGMSWTPACATKYIFRFHKKHGKEDLLKSLHYLDKAIERHVPALQKSDILVGATARFCSQVPNLQARMALYAVVEGRYAQARSYVEECLEMLYPEAPAPDLSAHLTD